MAAKDPLTLHRHAMDMPLQTVALHEYAAHANKGDGAHRHADKIYSVSVDSTHVSRTRLNVKLDFFSLPSGRP